MTEAMEQTGERFGPFRVFEQLGKGGSASVWRARRQCEDGTELEVSLKRLHPHLASDKDAVRRFVNEAQIASALSHDNICRFYELGRLDDQLFISMEYIDGVDLRRLLQDSHDAHRPPPVSVTLTLLSQLCDALEYAHNLSDDQTGTALDLVHRDISPSNLIVTRDGRLKLIDLGIAKTRATAVETKTGLVRGKFGYMAPEVLRGAKASRRSDIFSVGVVAWELLTAERLFGRTTDVATMERIRLGATEPPSNRNHACAPQLDSIVMRALRRDPGMRWPDAATLRTALHAAAATLHEPISSDVVRGWLDRSLSIPLQAPSPESDATTDALAIEEPTRPSGVRRFASGSAQVPALTQSLGAPPPVTTGTALMALEETTGVRHMAQWVRTRLAEEASRRRSLMWVLAVSLAINLLLLVAVLASSGRSASTAAPSSEMTAATTGPDARATRTDEVVREPVATVRAIDAGTRTRTRTTRPPEASAVPVPAHAPTPAPAGQAPQATANTAAPTRPTLPTPPRVRYARYPRSHSTTAHYSAHVCIDAAGRTESVQVTAGPERLYPRIRRYLSHWRYAPHRTGGVATAVCFDIHDRLRRAR